MAKIVLTNKEKEDIFFNALCDGLLDLESCGITINANEDDYKKAIKDFKYIHNTYGSIEEVYMQLLKNGDTLKVIDNETGTFHTRITIKDVYDKIEDNDFEDLCAMVNKDYDSVIASNILQVVMFNEVLFG